MKNIQFCGRFLEVLLGFPAVAKREAGYQLDRVQHKLEPTDWKPMPSIGSGVREIRIIDQGQCRVIYVAKFADTVARPACVPEEDPEDEEAGYRCGEAGAEAASE